jgi:hypothetical protein
MGEQSLGPVSYLVVEYPDNATMQGKAFAELVALVDRGLVRILDLVFVRKEDDGSVGMVAIADLDGDGTLDLAVFEGASSGLLGEDDVSDAGAVLAPGSSAAVLLYENRWAASFVHALRESGAELVAAGYVPQDELVAAAEALG